MIHSFCKSCLKVAFLPAYASVLSNRVHNKVYEIRLIVRGAWRTISYIQEPRTDGHIRRRASRDWTTIDVSSIHGSSICTRNLDTASLSSPRACQSILNAIFDDCPGKSSATGSFRFLAHVSIIRSSPGPPHRSVRPSVLRTRNRKGISPSTLAVGSERSSRTCVISGSEEM